MKTPSEMTLREILDELGNYPDREFEVLSHISESVCGELPEEFYERWTELESELAKRESGSP